MASPLSLTKNQIPRRPTPESALKQVQPQSRRKAFGTLLTLVIHTIKTRFLIWIASCKGPTTADNQGTIRQVVEVPSRLRLRRFLVLAGLLIWRDPLPFSAVPPSLSVGVVQSVQSPLGRGQYSETVGSLMDGGLPDLTHIDVPLDPAVPSETDRYRPITIFNIAEVAEKHPRLAPCVDDIRLSSLVFPFKASPYVVEELIDWQREGSITDDPFYRLIFPTMAMLSSEHQARLREAQEEPMELKAVVAQIRRELNPHPAVQKELNAPKEDRLTGVQQKYESPVLFFPAAAPTCQAYCTYCFRWTQFIGDSDLKFAQNDAEGLFSYLKTHSEVTDVLFTGGDPMIMKTRFLRKYLEPFKNPKFLPVNNLRIGTPSLSLPQCFLSDDGVIIRSQAPLMPGINDDAVWAEKWPEVKLGIVPYMFLAKNTGAQSFSVPLDEAHLRSTSGLCRRVPGIMGATAGKVEVGVEEVIVEPLNGMYLPWDKQGLPTFYLPRVGLVAYVEMKRPEQPALARHLLSIAWTGRDYARMSYIHCSMLSVIEKETGPEVCKEPC